MRIAFLYAVGAVGAALLLACDGPIVARSPEALYALAQEQIANASYSPAVDTLAKVGRESPQSVWARRAQVLRIALLAGMARSFKEIAESYLAGYEEAGAAPYAAQMRAMAMDYFGRARGRSIEIVEALGPLLRESAATPLRAGVRLPDAPGGGSDVLSRVRQGIWVEKQEVSQAEKDEVGQELAQVMATLTPTTGELDPASFYLAVAQEIVNLSSIYRSEALGDRRMFRLFHERAANAAARAGELAREKGRYRLAKKSERLLARCLDVIQNN